MLFMATNRHPFYTEKNLPKKYRSHARDYIYSRYLANDASFGYNKKVVCKIYLMANIIP